MASSAFEAVSDYSPLLFVDATPSVTVTRPSPASGTDYFTANGNPADMSDAGDVPNLNTSIWPDQWRQFRNPQFVEGIPGAAQKTGNDGRPAVFPEEKIQNGLNCVYLIRLTFPFRTTSLPEINTSLR